MMEIYVAICLGFLTLASVSISVDLLGIKNQIFRISQKDDETYEFYIVSAHIRYINERIIEVQDDGWRIAGDMNTYRDNGSSTMSDTYCEQPMKRKKP